MKGYLFKSKRCIIRTFEESDLDDFIEYRNNQEWMKYQGFKGLKKEEYRKLLFVPFNISEGGQLVIAEIETNKLIGDIYLKKDSEAIDIGYTINPKYAKQGYTTDAVCGLIDYLLDTYPECAILAETEIGNIPSENFLLKNGFVLKTESEKEKVFIYNKKG